MHKNRPLSSPVVILIYTIERTNSNENGRILCIVTRKKIDFLIDTSEMRASSWIDPSNWTSFSPKWLKCKLNSSKQKKLVVKRNKLQERMKTLLKSENKTYFENENGIVEFKIGEMTRIDPSKIPFEERSQYEYTSEVWREFLICKRVNN